MRTAMRFAVGGTSIAITAPSRTAVETLVADRLDAGAGFIVATLNLDHLVKLGRDPAFRDAYAAADIVTADGNPVVWLSRLAGRPVALAPGSEMIHPLCALAARRQAPVALLGSTKQTLDTATEALTVAHPGLRVVAAIAPPFGFDPTGPDAVEYSRRIAASGAQLCFVAMGAPKQEIFARNAAVEAPRCGFVCIGAGLDFIAGAQKRAPAWVRAMAAEWAWRLVGDPRRLAGRYLACATTLPKLALQAFRLRGEVADEASSPS